MKKKFTRTEALNGERITRYLSSKAKAFYDQTDPLRVYEYRDKNGDTLYAIRGFESRDDMTADDLDDYFCECYDEFIQKGE